MSEASTEFLHTAPLVLAVGGALLLAAALGFLARRLSLPAVVGYLVSGLLISPFIHDFVAGATQIIFEGVPTYPNAGRFWQMIERHKCTIFYTAPTAIRSLIKAGGDLPKQYDLKSLRILGTVGEPINPELEDRKLIKALRDRLEKGQHLERLAPAARRLRLAQEGERLADLAQLVRLAVHAPGDALDRAEQVDQHGHVVAAAGADDVLKQHRRPALGEQAGLDLGHLEHRRHRLAHPHEQLVALEPGQALLYRTARHAEALGQDRDQGPGLHLADPGQGQEPVAPENQ